MNNKSVISSRKYRERYCTYLPDFDFLVVEWVCEFLLDSLFEDGLRIELAFVWGLKDSWIDFNSLYIRSLIPSDLQAKVNQSTNMVSESLFVLRTTIFPGPANQAL